MRLYPSFKMAIGFTVSCKTCCRKDTGNSCKYYHKKQYAYNPHTEHIKYPNVPEQDVEWIGDDEDLILWSCPNWMPNYNKFAILIAECYKKHIKLEKNR